MEPDLPGRGWGREQLCAQLRVGPHVRGLRWESPSPGGTGSRLPGGDQCRGGEQRGESCVFKTVHGYTDFSLP